MATPVLTMVATPSPVAQGSSVSLDMLLTGAVDLYSYQLSLAFDPSLLQATSVTEGSFLAGGGSTFFGGGTIDNALGTISFMFDTLIGPIAGVTGTGILERISFSATHAGTSALTLSDAMFLNSSFDDVATQVVNSSLQVTPVTTPVPEPETFALLGVGLAGLAALRRRKASQAR